MNIVQRAGSAGVAPLTRGLLLAAAAVPFGYFGTLALASQFYPGYSHVTQYASEMGSAAATHPAIFNGGILLTGALALLGSVGFYRALRGLGSGAAVSGLFALAVALYGVAMFFGALFPMPDDRHGGYGTGIAVQFAPLLLLVALRRVRDLAGLKWFLAANAVAIIAMFAIMMGVGELVTRNNVGLFQRAYGLTVTPWMAVVAWCLLRRRA